MRDLLPLYVSGKLVATEQAGGLPRRNVHGLRHRG